ncbi:hypothetical protein [Acinetobacter sp. Marseille-Q1618]|uniref:hypothetical protein n=1 Tax=Acinetobacter sp. Marseille-Q1618 TaxID=2697502 RepID=UPI00156E9AAD|nr:hypothetical protein [Acinetobacter sp. Marseille-Q1618]
MKKFLKRNFPFIVLLIIVIVGFAYPFISGKWIASPVLREIDAKCYGILIPEEIKFNQAEQFCSCIRMSAMENNEEKSKYCANLVKRKF